jgi:hypothetical protein
MIKTKPVGPVCLGAKAGGVFLMDRDKGRIRAAKGPGEFRQGGDMVKVAMGK